MRPRAPALVVALAAGLALADAAIVALALPALLHDLHTSVVGVAAVVGVYTLGLAVGIPAALGALRRGEPFATAAGGLLVFAAASVVCAAAPSLAVLLVARAVQALGGALALVAAFDALEAGGRGRRLWLAAAVFGAAAGPAVGGALAQGLGWRAVFAVQAPVAVAAALALRGLPVSRPAPPTERLALAPLAALALVAGALTAVLVLLVLELVAGWSVAPIVAAAAVTALPVAALVSARLPGSARTRAVAGCLLAAAGALPLAFLPGASPWWTVPPQLLAGAGLGLALPALAGELMPERTASDAARLLAARHAGIVVALAILAPVVSAQLDGATRQAQLRGVAIVLDARLAPQDKLALAPALTGTVDAQDPRAALQRAIDAQRDQYAGAERAEFDRVARRAAATVVTAVGAAFRPAYLIAGGLALLAAAALALAGGAAASARRRSALRLAPVAAAAVALLALPVYAALHAALAPRPVAIRDPCQPRPLPQTGGLLGGLQDAALAALDRAACRFGSSREELVLALTDPQEARRFEAEHGVDPRSLGGVVQGLLG